MAFYFIYFLAVLCGMWDMWDLSYPGIESTPPTLGAWSLNHWTTREVPGLLFKSEFLPVQAVALNVSEICETLDTLNKGFHLRASYTIIVSDRDF